MHSSSGFLEDFFCICMEEALIEEDHIMKMDFGAVIICYQKNIENGCKEEFLSFTRITRLGLQCQTPV